MNGVVLYKVRLHVTGPSSCRRCSSGVVGVELSMNVARCEKHMSAVHMAAWTLFCEQLAAFHSDYYLAAFIQMLLYKLVVMEWVVCLGLRAKRSFFGFNCGLST